MNGKYIVIAIILVYLIVLLVVNGARIDINFLFFKIIAAKSMLILFSAVLGFIIGFFIAYRRQKSEATQK